MSTRETDLSARLTVRGGVRRLRCARTRAMAILAITSRSSLLRQVSTPMPAAGSASAPVLTGGECDTVGVTASKDETLVDKSSNTNVATKAAVGDEDKSKHEVSTHTAACRNGRASSVTTEALGAGMRETHPSARRVYAAVSGDCDVRALDNGILAITSCSFLPATGLDAHVSGRLRVCARADRRQVRHR